MNQLEVRTYTRREMAEITGQEPSSSHFARDVKRLLDKWGYAYEYKPSSIIITRRPETAEERLAELMIRQFELDVQINAASFACFFFLLLTDEDFACMPWAEREAKIFEQYGIEIAESTLRKWASRLLGTDLINKSQGNKVYWRTERFHNEAIRNPVAVDDEEYLRYKARQSALITEYLNFGRTKSEAWSESFKQLWREFQCCFYACPQFTVNALGHDIDEIVDWTEAICKEMNH